MTTTTTRTAILTGDTYAIRSVLKDAGWEWSPADKSWSKETTAQTPAEVFARLRTMMGGRGCGKLRCEMRDAE